VHCNLHSRNFIQYIYMNGEVHVMFINFFLLIPTWQKILNMCIYEVMSVGC